MLKIDKKKAAGQAATELAVFGAILIFLLGTIVRSALSNSYQQSQDFKAMRMAMLESWDYSKAAQGLGAVPNTSRNSAQILFIQDRLSPDYSKYGDLDRNPITASGSGTFSYNLLYPLSDSQDVQSSLPIMDTYINGQYFPFSQASYVKDKAIVAPTNCVGTPGSCSYNQCLRNQREWRGGIIKESSFLTTTVAPVSLSGTSAERTAQLQNNACTIFTDLEQAGIFTPGTTVGAQCDPSEQATMSTAISSPLSSSSQWTAFKGLYETSFASNSAKQNKSFLAAILGILQADGRKYKLFYTIVANPGGTISSQSPAFSTTAPTCASHPCKDKELSTDVPLLGYNGQTTPDGASLPSYTNSNGVMEFDLLRNGYYASAPAYTCPSPPCPSVIQQFPVAPSPNLRNFAAWQWAATAGTTAAMIGLNTSNNQYPTYDIDGRLKEVTIYSIYQKSGTTYVDYEDSEGGDIDQSWDLNSCGPKPGLQDTSTIYTFTQNGTYLHILEGKLYNPETNAYVRSVNKRDTIDLVQRNIQLSNNTGRFCTLECSDGSVCNSSGQCSDGSTCTPSTPLACIANDCADYPAATNPNPVEVCVDESSPSNTCYTQANIAKTCYDVNQNVIFVRSRIEDRRGRFWMTDASGHLGIK